MEVTPMNTHKAIAVISLLVLGTVVMGMQSSRSETIVGEIASVDANGNSLTVEDTSATGSSPETMTFKVDAQTKIQSAPAAGMTKEEPSSLSLKDLKAGERVKVNYVGSEGEYVARTIEVQANPTS
jgi:hypothetical protein